MTDSELIHKIKSGDQSAFFYLVEKFRHLILNTCYRFLLNKQDAEDVSQDVFVEIYLSISQFRGESKLSTWVYRVAVTKCLDEIKKRKRKKRISSAGRFFGLEFVTDWLISDNKADDKYIEKEELRELESLLSKLSDNQRIALTLSKMDGYSNAEIAAIMKLTKIGVESLVYRAKKKLEEEYKKNKKRDDSPKIDIIIFKS